MTPGSSECAPSWGRWHWTLVIGVIAAGQIGLVLALAHWPRLPAVERPASPWSLSLNLPESSSPDSTPWVSDPRLFALPDSSGFSGVAARALPTPEYRLAEWSGRPRWLSASTPNALGSVPTVASPPISTRPTLPLTLPASTNTPRALASQSSASLRGDLAQRPFTAVGELLPAAGSDALSATVIELAVSASGDVMSARLVSSSGNRDADTQALAWARTLTFAAAGAIVSPSASDPQTWTQGELVVIWSVQPSLR